MTAPKVILSTNQAKRTAGHPSAVLLIQATHTHTCVCTPGEAGAVLNQWCFTRNTAHGALHTDRLDTLHRLASNAPSPQPGRSFRPRASVIHEGDNRKGRSDYRLGIGGKIQKFETWPPSGSEYRPNLRGGGIDLRFCDTPTRAFMNKLEELEHLFKAAERNESRLHQVRMGEMCHRGLTTVSGYHVCVTTAVDHLARDAIQAHPWKSGVTHGNLVLSGPPSLQSSTLAISTSEYTQAPTQQTPTMPCKRVTGTRNRADQNNSNKTTGLSTGLSTTAAAATTYLSRRRPALMSSVSLTVRKG